MAITGGRAGHETDNDDDAKDAAGQAANMYAGLGATAVATTTDQQASTTSLLKEDGVTPYWVHADYSYDPANPRKPNMRELSEAIGGKALGDMTPEEYKSATSQSSSLLYGVVGSNQETRNWNDIMNEGVDSPGKLVAAAQIATSQMYGGTTVKYQSGGYQTDADGNVVKDAGGTAIKLPDNLYIMGGNGTVLTGLSGNADSMSKALQNFGVRDSNWITEASSSMSAEVLAQYQPSFNSLKTSYNPWADYEYMWDKTFTSGVTPFQDPFKINEVTGTQSAVEEKTGVEQTITAPLVAPGSQTTPDTEETVPVIQPSYTPSPTILSVPQVAPTTTGDGVYSMAPITGTMSTPLQTAGISAVPQTIQTMPDYTGTSTSNLTSQSQQGFGGQRTYGDAFGTNITVTVDSAGKPLTYVPPGYTPVQGQNKGGAVQGYAEGGTVDSALLIIARMNGFGGDDINSAKTFMNSSEGLRRKARAVGVAMSKGGMTKKPIYAAEGTFVQQQAERDAALIEQTMQPMQSNVQYIQPQAADFIGSAAGQAAPISPMAQATTVGNVQQSMMPTMTAANTAAFTPAYAGVQAETAGTQAAQGVVSTQAQPIAAQQQTSAVTGMTAAQGTATMVNAPAAREIQAGEIISGVADAEKAATFNEQIQAATATPSTQATVQGQLEGLMQQFEGGNTPAWAAGSMRAATATLAARGLGASSMAGQAIIQASMEAALPIAQMDAQVQAQFEGQNLSNRQARAMLSAQQRAQFLGMEFDQAFQARVQNSARVGDIANMNFTAEQNIALENSRSANTMNLNNLSNRQAMVMAEAAALSNLDMANLNNRQQTAVQNAQNFMQMDMTNLSNEQQTTMFKSQQNIQALFTDQAAENAAAQFNASSENQTNQFFANLASQTGQFNASQQNAMDQFNVNSVNALREFNSEIQQQRDLFNAQNGLVIAQSNAQWRQNLTTLNTAAQNESNMDFAKTMAGFTARNLDSYWQTERDIMSFAFQTENNNADRATSIALQSLKNEAGVDEAAASKSSIFSKLAGTFVDKVIFG